MFRRNATALHFISLRQMNMHCATRCGWRGPRGRVKGESDPEAFSHQPVRTEGAQATLAGPGGRAVGESQLPESLYLCAHFRTGRRLRIKRLFTQFLSRCNTARS